MIGAQGLYRRSLKDLFQRSRQDIRASPLKRISLSRDLRQHLLFRPAPANHQRLSAPPKLVKYPSGCATRLAKSKQPLSHSATLPEWLPQLLSHSATLPEWLPQPLSHSATLPEWRQQPLSHSASGCRSH